MTTIITDTNYADVNVLNKRKRKCESGSGMSSFSNERKIELMYRVARLVKDNLLLTLK